MGKKSFTSSELATKVRYCPRTGLFYSLRNTNNASIGDVVTCMRHDGYCRVNVFGGRFLAHRLAWFYVYGYWPEIDIDHIDGNPSNNALANLREVTRHENLQNICKVRKNSSTGINNISFCAKSQKFVVQLMIQRQHKFGGEFVHIEDAIAALKQLKTKWHPLSPLNKEV